MSWNLVLTAVIFWSAFSRAHKAGTIFNLSYERLENSGTTKKQSSNFEMEVGGDGIAVCKQKL